MDKDSPERRLMMKRHRSLQRRLGRGFGPEVPAGTWTSVAWFAIQTLAIVPAPVFAFALQILSCGILVVESQWRNPNK